MGLKISQSQFFYTQNNTKLAKIDQSECVNWLGESEEADEVLPLPNC